MALDTRELLDSRPCSFILDEMGRYKLPTRLGWRQNQSWTSGEERKHSPLPEFERGPTAPVSFKKSQVEKVSNLLINGCCDHSWSFVYHSLPVLGVMYFISSCEDVTKWSIRDFEPSRKH